MKVRFNATIITTAKCGNEGECKLDSLIESQSDLYSYTIEIISGY